DDPHKALKNKRIVDSGCSRHMTGNKAYLVDYQDYNGGPVAFEGSKGHITGKGKIRIGKLDFKDVCFVKELQHFNLFSVSQICDKKNKVLFTDTECLVLSPDFKLLDENQVLLRVPRQNNIAEGALNLEELLSIFTNLSNIVLALETVKDAQAAEIIALKVRIKKLEKKYKPNISHHRAWLKSVQRLSMKKRFRKKECVSKQGRKKEKPEPTLDDSTFDGLDADLNADHGMDYMDTAEPVNEGRLSEETEKLKLTADTEEITQDKGSGEKGGSTKELVSTARPEDTTVRLDVGTADPIAPPRTTTSIFDDEDITMAQTLIKMKKEKAKEKEMSIKDIKDSSRPTRSILTLKPLLTIDPKDKGKGVLEEPEPAKKMTRSDLDAA
nr:ribonuclease H-like domain-containing protein [Tanacetum cinerariifolium]